MPKYSLLDMTQSILSDNDEDEVNSVSDTLTSLQVVNILKDTYFALVSERKWPTHEKLRTLNASTDSLYPTHMKLPDGVMEIDVNTVRYNIKDQMSDATGLDNYADMVFLEPSAFLDFINARNPAESNILTVVDNLTTNRIKLKIATDKDPEFFTTFDDEYLVFDSYDSSYDDTLQEQKSLVSVLEEPAWENKDDFVPDVPSKFFPLYLAEAKKASAIKLRQTNDPVEVERARRQRTWMAGEKHRVRNKGVTYPNYGRK
jgi:hypothetical protein